MIAHVYFSLVVHIYNIGILTTFNLIILYGILRFYCYMFKYNYLLIICYWATRSTSFIIIYRSVRWLQLFSLSPLVYLYSILISSHPRPYWHNNSNAHKLNRILHLLNSRC
jgi:hypothetical protein